MERVIDRAVGKTRRYFISNAPIGTCTSRSFLQLNFCTESCYHVHQGIFLCYVWRLRLRALLLDAATLYFTVLYCTVLYCTVLYCTVLYCTVLYCTVLYCSLVSVTYEMRTWHMVIAVMACTSSPGKCIICRVLWSAIRFLCSDAYAVVPCEYGAIVDAIWGV